MGTGEVTLRNEWRVAGQPRGEATENRLPQRCETVVTGGLQITGGDVQRDRGKEVARGF